MAAEYSRELSAKTRRGKRRQALRGFAQGSVAPFGFRRCVMSQDGGPGPTLAKGERKNRLDQDVGYTWGTSDEVATIRLIFKLYVHGRLKPGKIAIHLNSKGKRWKDGSLWTNRRVSQVLRCELVVGDLAFNKTRVTLEEGVTFLAPDQWMRRTVLKPMISRKLFRTAQQRMAALASPSIRSSRFERTEAEMLSDLERLIAKHGRLSISIIDASYETLNSCAYRLRFGSMAETYARIGHPEGWPQPLRNGCDQRATRRDIVDGLRRLHRATGQVSLRAIANDRRLPSVAYIRHKFGSTAAAFEAAGVPRPYPRKTHAWRKAAVADPRPPAFS
jgi:hypothetical protein